MYSFYIIRFLLILVIEWAQKDENNMTGHNIMAKKPSESREISKFSILGNNLMSSD